MPGLIWRFGDIKGIGKKEPVSAEQIHDLPIAGSS